MTLKTPSQPMKELAEFLVVAHKELVRGVEFSFAPNGQFAVKLTAVINDRKYEATEVGEDLDLACKGALYQWCEGLKVNPPADTPKPKSTPDKAGRFHCGGCGKQLTETEAKLSPPDTCRDVKCIQEYWLKRANLRRGFKG